MNGYQFIGNFSAVEPVYSRHMSCHDCEVEWTGCWDNFQCPKCGAGEIPNNDFPDLLQAIKKEAT
tara:strand:+ start:924 stop:1118 length:195 start_codon:yes stop_codon:yes gene_type:complete